MGTTSPAGTAMSEVGNGYRTALRRERRWGVGGVILWAAAVATVFVATTFRVPAYECVSVRPVKVGQHWHPGLDAGGRLHARRTLAWRAVRGRVRGRRGHRAAARQARCARGRQPESPRGS